MRACAVLRMARRASALLSVPGVLTRAARGRLGDQGHSGLPSLTDRTLHSLQSSLGGNHALRAMQTPGGLSSTGGLSGGLGGGGVSQAGGREGLGSLAGLSGLRSSGQVLSPLTGVSGLLAPHAQAVFPSHSAAMHHAQQQPQEQVSVSVGLFYLFTRSLLTRLPLYWVSF